VEQLITTKKSLACLIKKYQKKEINDTAFLFTELEKL
jgi:hypothetical protein